MSTSGYFRRSRNGCATCRRSRLKCDEAKPQCKNCSDRDIKCDGYSVKLRWVEDTYTEQSSTTPTKASPCRRTIRHHRSSSSTLPSTAQSRQGGRPSTHQDLLPQVMSILPDASKLEMYLLDYSLAVVSKVAFLDAGSSPHPYQHIAIALNMGPNSILFNCVVAHSAAHLNQAGHVSEQVLLARKSRALHSLRTAIMSAISGQHSYPDANEMNFCASVMLVGLATTEGSPLSEVLQLVKGSAILWNEYRRTTQGDDSMLSNSTKRMLAYFDILSSVPYPRAPALPVDMWLGSGNVVGQSFHIDPLMGCLTNLFALIAECSRSIFHYYSGNTNHLDFTAQKTSLLNHLSQWQHPLPADFEAIHGYDWTTSAHAGEAYKLATQIYLLCSCNSQIDSRLAASHVRQLRYAVFSIPVHSPFIAMMLWPAFVLGCETREQIQRERIEKWFQDVFVKQGFGNIRVALNALKCIWRLMDSRAAQAERSKLPSEGAFLCREEDRVTCQSQSKYSWVMLCWEEQISLNLA